MVNKPPVAALYLGYASLMIGIAGFIGPFVSGNQEGLINIETGQLFGLMAINWAHALVFLAFGLYGVTARGSHNATATYLWSMAVAFGLLAVLGLLGQAGWMEVTDPEGTVIVYEIAVDAVASLLHLGLAAAGLFLAFRIGADARSREHQPTPA